MRRLLTATAICLLLAVAFGVTLTPPAAASEECPLVLEPFIERDGRGFNDALGGDTVSGSDLVAFAGTTEAAADDAAIVVSLSTVPDDVRAFYTDVLEWLAFVDSDVCADALPYPGEFQTPPPDPVSPFGFSVNPVAQQTLSYEAEPLTVALPDPLAHSGSESGIFLFFGCGLVAFGALALGTRRRLL